MHMVKKIIIGFYLFHYWVFAQAVNNDDNKSKIAGVPFSISMAVVHSSQTEIRNNYKFTATCYERQNAYSFMIGGAEDDNGKKREVSIQYNRYHATDYNRSMLFGFESMYLVYTPSSPESKYWGISFGPNVGYQKAIFKNLFLRGQLGVYLFASQGHSNEYYRSGTGFLPNLRINLGWVFNHTP